MPRIIVKTDAPTSTDHGSILLDEHVHSVHLSTGHGAAQLIERIAWAISDAEDAQEPPHRLADAAARGGRPGPVPPARAALAGRPA
jgi:hypothetical protein